MNPRITGILFLVALALGAFVYLYEVRGEEGRLEAEVQAKRLFPDVESDAVEWIALTTTDGRVVRAESAAGDWQIVEPLAFPGDAFALDAVASTLAQLESEAVFEEPQAAGVYGLDDDTRELRFSAAGSEHALRTGDDAPMGGNSYVSVVGSAPVHMVPTYRVNALRKAYDDLRDKQVMPFDTAAAQRVVASWPGGRVELLRGEDVWRLTAPVDGAADEDTVSGLLRQLSTLRADGFEDAPLPDHETGLDAPDFAVEVTLAPEGEGAERVRLSLALGAEADEVRLGRAAQLSLYRIPAARIEDFPRKVVAYRFKRLADFDPADAQQLEIVFSDEGTHAITARREPDGWRADPEPMDPDKIARLVDELSDLEADDILAERVGPEELAALGLDPPRATLLVSGAGEADAPRLAELRIGMPRGSEGFIAQSGESPIVFAIAGHRAEHIPVSLEAFRNRFLAEPEPEPAAEPALPGFELPEDLLE
jgi:hypothetical protein